MNVFSISCMVASAWHFLNPKNPKIDAYQYDFHCMVPKWLYTYNHFWVTFGPQMVTIQPLKVTSPWNPSGPCCNEDLISAQEDLQLNGGLHSMIQASRLCCGWLFFFVVGPASFFFPFFRNFLLSTPVERYGQNGFNGATFNIQHHDMSAAVVFVWCFFFFFRKADLILG